MRTKPSNQNLNLTPYCANFNRANYYDYWIIGFAFLTIVISLFTGRISSQLSQSIFLFLFFSQVFLAFASFFLKRKQGSELSKAYKEKKKCEIDNAFGSKLSPNVVVDYFDVGNIDLGFKRLLAITHENALFTCKNSAEYKRGVGYVTALFGIILIYIVVQGIHVNNFSLSLLNFVMGSLFLDRYLSSSRLSEECGLITDECIHIIDSWDEKSSYTRVINVFVSYNNLLGVTKVNIDPRIHKNFMGENNKEWDKVFTRYYLG